MKWLGIIGAMEIFHMLAENSIKLNITHIYLVTGGNPVNGWTWPAEMESALCTRIESINKNTTQFPSATFLIHLSYTFRIHHAFHCNSAAKAHTKEMFLGPTVSRLDEASDKDREEKQIYPIITLVGCKHDPSWEDLPSFVSSPWQNI